VHGEVNRSVFRRESEDEEDRRDGHRRADAQEGSSDTRNVFVVEILTGALKFLRLGWARSSLIFLHRNPFQNIFKIL
jgi:hypothetical protein